MTRRLYLADSYRTEFDAGVVSVEPLESGGVSIELDQTAFYAESGGQPADHGTLADTEVTDVQLSEGRLLHFADAATLRPGHSISGRIDWDRRFDHMQQHTGQHLLSQAFVKTLDVATVSFHLGREISTLDLETEELRPETIYAAEELANQVVFENRVTVVHEVQSSEQSRFPLRKPSPREGMIRIVEIAGFDWSPCGGTHCARTGDVGLIKVRRWERSRGKARVEFVCGRRALADYRRKNRALYELTRQFSVPHTELVEAARLQAERLEVGERQIRNLRKKLLSFEAERLVAEAVPSNGIELIQQEFEDIEPDELRELALSIVNSAPNRVVLLALRHERPLLLLACSPELDSLDLRPILAQAATEIDGRGGGSPQLVQAGGKRVEGLESALNKARVLLETL